MSNLSLEELEDVLNKKEDSSNEEYDKDRFVKQIMYGFKNIRNKEVRDVAAAYILSDEPINKIWKAIYFLTDEDYINERDAIMFFAKDVKLKGM